MFCVSKFARSLSVLFSLLLLLCIRFCFVSIDETLFIAVYYSSTLNNRPSTVPNRIDGLALRRDPSASSSSNRRRY